MSGLRLLGAAGRCEAHDQACAVWSDELAVGQGLDLLEIRGWDDAALGVIEV